MLDLLLFTSFNRLQYINYFVDFFFFYCTVVSCKSCTELFNNTSFFFFNCLSEEWSLRLDFDYR